MNAYTSLAEYYDLLTRDVPYQAIADFYEALFRRAGIGQEQYLTWPAVPARLHVCWRIAV